MRWPRAGRQRPVEYTGPAPGAQYPDPRRVALCGAIPAGADAPPDGVVHGCSLPDGHRGGRHVSDATVGDRTVPGGYTWPTRRRR